MHTSQNTSVGSGLLCVEKLVNNWLDDAVLKRAVHRGLDDGETRGPSRMADVRQHVVHLAVLDRNRV